MSRDGFKKGSGKNYPIKFIGSDHVKFDSQKVENVIVIGKNSNKRSSKIRKFL
ncbi:hypothetical protein HMPREF1253_1943 [Peptoniphilus sp. BV3C26]|nr:hypothetical protein HMPREF1253_1943 [Peptoniphilus sp. BV3C26]